MVFLLVLLRIGLAMRRPLLSGRWSLTPPFQYCLCNGMLSKRAFPAPPCALAHLLAVLHMPSATCFLLRFPVGYPSRPLAGILPCEARTFLPERQPASPRRSSGPPSYILNIKAASAHKLPHNRVLRQAFGGDAKEVLEEFK